MVNDVANMSRPARYCNCQNYVPFKWIVLLPTHLRVEGMRSRGCSASGSLSVSESKQ